MRLDHIPDISKMVGLLRTYNQWRRSEIEGSMDELGLHPTDIGKAIDAVLDDYAALQAECASLKNSLLAITTRHFAERWKQTSKDSELEQYLSAGIAQLEEERDAVMAECERLRRENVNIRARWAEYARELETELAAIKAQEPVNRAHVMDALLMWNRLHEHPPINVGYEYGVAEAVMAMIDSSPSENQQLPTVK